jgi:adenylate kinase
MVNVILIGPPGSGKGTLAGMFKDDLGLLHISTGDILREEIKNRTDLGRVAKEWVDSGHLVPDAVVIEIVVARLANPDIRGRGFLLDGFPRTVAQATALDKVLKERGIRIDGVVVLEFSVEILLERLCSRRVCRACKAVYNTDFKPPRQEGVCDLCGGEVYQRQDDRPETIRDRLAVYESETAPVIGYYEEQGLIRRIANAAAGAKPVFAETRRILGV